MSSAFSGITCTVISGVRNVPGITRRGSRASSPSTWPMGRSPRPYTTPISPAESTPASCPSTVRICVTFRCTKRFSPVTGSTPAGRVTASRFASWPLYSRSHTPRPSSLSCPAAKATPHRPSLPPSGAGRSSTMASSTASTPVSRRAEPINAGQISPCRARAAYFLRTTTGSMSSPARYLSSSTSSSAQTASSMASMLDASTTLAVRRR